MSRFPFFQQLDWNDCGPSCVKMIAKYYGKDLDLEYLRKITYINNNGVSLLGISEAFDKINLSPLMLRLKYEKLVNELPLPAVLHWNKSHFVVLYDIKGPAKRKFWRNRKKSIFVIGDPAHGIVNVDEDTFLKSWISTQNNEGIVLTVTPTKEFYEEEDIENAQNAKKGDVRFLLNYIRPYRRYFYQIFIGMISASIISLIFPFTTQALVDYGISSKSYNLVHLILASQILLYFGDIVIEVLRNRILLNVNSRISISLISDFLKKLMRLPIKFFDSRSTGDLTQRIQDHRRIEEFLTGTSFSTVFSLINMSVFSIILYLYSPKMFLIFILLSTVSVLWIIIFLDKRKNIDYKRFQRQQENQDTLLELIRGIREIKLYNAEISRRWKWERSQLNIYKLNLKSLYLDQYQLTGFSTITQLKNIIVSYIAAVETMSGTMSLGMMLSVSYIIGQTNGPMQRLGLFFRSLQDAKISFNRLNEIHNINDETHNPIYQSQPEFSMDSNRSIQIKNLKFQYGSSKSQFVLNDINLTIPKGKVTAVVGTSGSGKTTLMKLLLRFYDPTSGEILLDNINIKNHNTKYWRDKCGVVMQDGYVFADTILNNIAIDGNAVDKDRLEYALRMSNLKDLIESRPLGLLTNLASGGGGLSGGQIQRVLIARAIYKNPDYLFLDEATSSLDANTEKVIIENLNTFFKQKTVFVIAHRLSTVKNAHQIVVMERGEIVELGNHESLVKARGNYYNLVKNQLELEKEYERN